MNSKPALTTSGNILTQVAALLVLVPGLAMSQVPVDEYGAPLSSIDGDLPMDAELAAEAPLLTSVELADLVGPVALYPDDLLAIVLPASTYPLEIVQAARFLEQFEADSSLEPDEAWDESITALLNYPEIVQMMDEDIDWTWRLGEAVIAQQEELIAAIETFRDRAYAAGNLKTDEHQEVSSNDDGIIEIVPVDEELIYVPYYEPEEVLVYQPRQVYNYYPRAYPVYYYPYPAGHHFSSGYFWGVTTAFSIGWNNNYLHVYHPSYWGHPYYGHSYYSHYYRRPSINVYNNWYVNNSYRTSRHRYRDGDYWRPRHRSGARPQEQRVRNHYYPSRNNENTRRSNVSYDRDQRQLRDQGRTSLGLRERSQSGASTAANRSVVTRNNVATATNGSRRERQTEQRRPRDNNGANIRSSNRQLSDQVSERANRSNRRNTDAVAANRNTQRATSSNNSQPQRNQQRRVPTNSASRSPTARQASSQRRSTPPGSSVQPRRTQATSNRSAPATRAPATSSRDRAPARQQEQRSSNSGQSNAASRRQESSARVSNRQRKRKQ